MRLGRMTYQTKGRSNSSISLSPPVSMHGNRLLIPNGQPSLVVAFVLLIVTSPFTTGSTPAFRR